MDHQLFDEKLIEELLQNMPKVSDHRQSAEIFQAVEAKLNHKHRNRKLYLIPSLSILAAVILFVLISPVFLQKSIHEQKSEYRILNKEIAHSSKNDTANSKTSKQNIKEETKMSMDDGNKTAVYEEDVKGSDLLTYGVFTPEAVLIPVSVVVSKDGTDWISEYKAMANLFSEKMKGLDNYLPIHGDVKYDPVEKKITISIPKRSLSTITEIVQANLDKLIQYSFAYQDVHSVAFTDENGKPIEIGELGPINTKIINKEPQTAFYLYHARNGDQYLLPGDDSYQTLQDAFEAMKLKPDDFHLPLISKDINIIVTKVSRTQVIIHFTNPIHLSKLKNAMLMVEGILLTAKNFGFTTVQFENIETSVWNGFDFSKPVCVPLAPNRIHLQ